MGLETWSSLRPHQPTIAEIQQLFQIVDRDLGDAGKDVSADNRFNLAFNAARQLCAIALHAEGYEVRRGERGGHNIVINALPETLAETYRETCVFLSACSSIRNRAWYESAGVVTQERADELVDTAHKLRTDVVAWLKRVHPGLLPDAMK